MADWGALPLLAHSAAAAMAVMTDLAPAAPDAAIVDQDIIGEVSGVALLDRIAARFGVALPAVILTGETSAGTREELIESGHPWLLKPADPDTLHRLLAEAIAAARSRPLRGGRDRARPTSHDPPPTGCAKHARPGQPEHAWREETP